MGEEGFEPTMFTTRDEIYSLAQHHQSLLLTQKKVFSLSFQILAKLQFET